MSDHETFDLGDMVLQQGATLRDAKLAYKTYGTLNGDKSNAIVMPAEKDLYFPPEDEEYAIKHMKNAELRVIPGVWGHFADGGINSDDIKFIDEALKELLAS